VAHLFENKDRHVIPNWRTFENTAKLGELNGSKSIRLDTSFKPDISDVLEDWIDSKSIGVAADIIGLALVCNQENNPIVQEISRFILNNRDKASEALIIAANNVLSPPKVEIELKLDIDSIELFKDKSHLLIIHQRINSLKKKLRQNPNNPINWIEIGRLYTIIGQEEKAKTSIRNALYLAPENRFVLRNMARFFIHFGEEGITFAHNVIRNSEIARFDPWIIATEISLATLRDRGSKFAKVGIQIIDAGSFHPFNISELASSLATLELKNDKLKKSKKLFGTSLVHPNDNSLAQAEWASQLEKGLLPVNSQGFKLINSFEALARDFAEHKKWEEAIECSKKWFLDLPFSKGSVLFANDIAIHKLKDHSLAVEVAKLGLDSHPNDAQLLNNIIYSLCIENKIEEAEILFQKVKKDDLTSLNDIGICLTATKGLYYFRKGIPDAGRKLYLEAIHLAEKLQRNYLLSSALINYIREEILLGKEDVSPIITKLGEIIKLYDGKDLADDARTVIELYNQRK